MVHDGRRPGPRGGGPTLVESVTYRWKGHSKSDKNLYRTREEIAAWQERDPITRFEEDVAQGRLPDRRGDRRPPARRRRSDAGRHPHRQRRPAGAGRPTCCWPPSTPMPRPLTTGWRCPHDHDPHDRGREPDGRSGPCRRRCVRSGRRRRRDRRCSGADLRRGGPRGPGRPDGDRRAGVPARRGHRRLRRGVRRHQRPATSGSAASGCATPRSPSSRIVGAGVGAALCGLRPIVEIQFSDFVTCAMDQIVNQAAKIHFMLGGAARCRW